MLTNSLYGASTAASWIYRPELWLVSLTMCTPAVVRVLKQNYLRNIYIYIYIYITECEGKPFLCPVQHVELNNILRIMTCVLYSYLLTWERIEASTNTTLHLLHSISRQLDIIRLSASVFSKSVLNTYYTNNSLYITHYVTEQSIKILEYKGLIIQKDLVEKS